jgi:hypothetical protein
MGQSEAGPGRLSTAWLDRVRLWSWAASSVSAYGTGGDFNPFFYYQNDSNLSQTSKIHIKFNIRPKFKVYPIKI